MKSYSFKSGYGSFNSNVDPQKVGTYLERLCKSASDSLTAEMVVDSARSSESLLHPLFEWDNEIAGELYRREQARALLRCLVIKEDQVGGNENREIRAFIHVKTVKMEDNEEKENPGRDVLPGSAEEEQHPAAYYPIAKILNEKELRERLVMQALKELLSWQERYRVYKELVGIHACIAIEVAEVLRKFKKESE